MNDFVIVIPARYASTRLPGKPLLEIAGKPLVQHVYECAQTSGAREIVIATDDQRIATAATAFGANVCMTKAEHPSGSDRCAEVAEQQGWDDQTILVNVQGDEPLLPAAAIQQVANNLAQHPEAAIATLATPIDDVNDMANPNAVKVVRDNNGLALYFSRAPIPWHRDVAGGDVELGLRHLGLYAYRVGALKKITTAAPAALEQSESLEQLRALALGYRIHVDIAVNQPGPGVDTPDDLLKVAALMAS